MGRQGRAADDATLAAVHQALIVDGMSQAAAAKAVGVSRRSVGTWSKDPDALRSAAERVESSKHTGPAEREPPRLGQMDKVGRPSIIIDDGVRGAVLGRLARGLTRSVACRAVGISTTTLLRWTKRGEAGDEPYASFIADIEAADASGECVLQERVIAGSVGWQGAAWMLERTRRDYGKRDEVVHVDGGALADMDDDEVARLLAEAEAAEGAA